MQVDIHEIGQSKSRIVIIDNFLKDPNRIIDQAAALAPFPKEGTTAYPGQRRQLSPSDAVSAYIIEALQLASPLINEAFGPLTSVIEASFSLLTTRPEALNSLQRIPHYDTYDPEFIAVLHHLHHVPDTGTAFYRHVRTGLERVDSDTAPLLNQARKDDESIDQPHLRPHYIYGSNEHYEKIFQADGHFNRLLIYQGCLLHSGVISPKFSFSQDPRTGRLTSNIFIKANLKTRQ